jgi:hypothetical protein
MDVSPLKVQDARVLTSGRIEQLPEVLASRNGRQLISAALGSKLSYTHAERAITHEDNLTEAAHVAPLGK